MQVERMKIEIKVLPNSGKQKIILDKNNYIKIYLKSAPKKGYANRELIKFLSKKLGIAKNDIEIVRGRTLRKKLLEINQLSSMNEFFEKIALEVQNNIFS